MDLDARTLDTLDWSAVLQRLSDHARTLQGQRAALALTLASDRDAVMAMYAAVQEVLELELEERVPVSKLVDLVPAVQRASQGRVLEPHELSNAGKGLFAMESLRMWLVERADDAPVLAGLAEDIDIDPELQHRLVGSFDEHGELSEEMYPEIGELRRTIRSLSSKVQSTLDRLIKSSDMSGVLQDRFVTQREGRYVLPVRAEAKRKGLGIVHDTSNSGETVFIEPGEVVELNNRIRVMEGDLRRAVHRVLSALSSLLSRFAEPVLQSVQAGIHIDLACARADLGRELGAHIPHVSTEGTVRLVQARHPVLQLRGIDVVPNDLWMSPQRQGMILSGPNTGGKTVALKTLGLAALCVRAGIPVPADEGSRVDLFPEIIADIGDLQTVQGDLSTFSGHVLVLREVLRRSAPGTLVLLDEVAVGTDPAQGAALATAVIERIVDAGARIAVTTHYTDLKAFATADPRFVNCAVQLEDGQPSYRLQEDTVGLSHAFRIARRLGLNAQVVDRAESLLSEEARQVGGLLERLEDQRVAVDMTQRDLAERERVLAEQERKVQVAWDKVSRRARKLEQEQAARTIARLQQAEDDVKGLIAALQSNPDLRTAGRTLAQIREASQGLIPEEAPVVVAPPPRTLSVGDRVRVRSLNRAGKVVAPPRKGQVELDLNGLRTRVKLKDVVLVAAKAKSSAPVVKSAPPSSVPAAGGRKVGREDLGGVRLDSNTLDLRGKRVEEGMEALELFLDRMVMRNFSVVFVLHGHGTGAMKKGVREAMRKLGQVRTWRPADVNEGGDAYTIVGL